MAKIGQLKALIHISLYLWLLIFSKLLNKKFRNQSCSHKKISLWGPVISGVLLRLYGMGLLPNDPIRGHWQVRGWSVKVITGVALKEELKVFMVIPNLFEVKSHLGTFVWDGLKPSYPSEYSFNVTSWQGVEHWIRGEEGGKQISTRAITSTINAAQLIL